MGKSKTCKFSFHAYSVNRNIHMAKHEFFWEQAKEKIFSHFGNMDPFNEASSYIAAHPEKIPEANENNYQDVEEFTYDLKIGYGVLFDEFRENIYLASLAHMYFLWDKSFREFICSGVRHDEDLKNLIWGARIGDIWGALNKSGWDNVKQTKFYNKLTTCRQLVNAFKHGEGGDFSKIKKSHKKYISPEVVNFFSNNPDNIVYAYHDNLQISKKQFDEFASAILQFWQNFPTQQTFELELRCKNKT